MFKYINAIALIAAVVTLVGCGGGGSGDSPATSSAANGLWSGTQSVNGYVYDINAIVYQGEIIGISYDAYSNFIGSYSMSSDQMEGSYKLYYGDGTFLANGSLSATVVESLTLNGSFSNSLGENGTISASFDPQYNNPSSLDYIAGSFSGITISTSGAISGYAEGCTVSGNIHVPDPSVNIYDVSYQLSDCDGAGTYNGLGTIVLDSGHHLFIAGAGNSNYMVVTELYLD
jgi:hypothetical protein